ncbi:papilin-like [Ciona intestinalis]
MVNCRRNIAVFVGVVCLAQTCLSLSVLTLQSNETLLEVEHGWGAWGEWEPCSRSCGGGVTFMQRDCLLTRSNGLPDCIGQSRKYSSCFIQDCPDGSVDFRSEQCSNFNNRSFDGRRHAWTPYVGSSVSNPCELHCQPEEESFFIKLADKVVDGTRCDDVSFNVCVDGACQEVGCDMMLGSGLREDRCRECGGDGSSCYHATGIFSTSGLRKGYTVAVAIPAGATNIEILESSPSRNYLALRDDSGNYALNGGWKIERSRTLQVAGTVVHYLRRPRRMRAPEKLTALGPTLEKLFVDVIVQERNKEISYSYYLPHGISGTIGDVTSWRAGNWSLCSVDCGEGLQRRRVSCYRNGILVRSRVCDVRSKPLVRRRCNSQPCVPRLLRHRWLTGSWGECSQPCNGGVKTRDVRCVQGERLIIDDVHCSNVTAKPANQEACMEMPCPDWTVGAWSECSGECGEGMQTRRVVCAVLHNDENEELSTHLCNGEKPPTVQHCSNSACEASWFSGSWTGCTSSCGEGRRTRHVMCLSEVTYLPVRDGDCDEIGKPPVVEPCNLASCPRISIVDCHVTAFGCCPDNKTPSSGEDMQGCPRRGQTCRTTRYGCCKNGYNAATGPNHYGCAEYDVCYVTPDRGSLCDAWVSRWFFNPSTSQCEHFWYGGCHGNTNRYVSKAECKAVCDVSQDNGNLTPTTTRITTVLTTIRTTTEPTTTTTNVPTTTRRTLVFLSDSTLQTPPEVISRFPLHVAKEAFHANIRTRAPESMESFASSLRRSKPDLCSLPPTRGPCFGRFERWFYDQLDHSCKSFAFGGCAGNENNFQSRKLCENVCKNVETTTAREPSKCERDRVLAVFTGRRRVGCDPSGAYSALQCVNDVTSSTCWCVNPVSGREIIGSKRHGIAPDCENLSVTSRPPCNRKNAHSSGDQHCKEYLRIRSSHTSIRVKLNDPARLPCHAEGFPEPQVYWLRNGRRINFNRTSSGISQDPFDHSMIFVSVRREDTGSYVCVATNGVSRDIRKKVRLILTERRVRFRVRPTNVTVTSGRQVKLRCRIRGGSAKVTWLKNGRPLTRDNHYVIKPWGDLRIYRSRVNDSGNYTCLVNTADLNATAKVTVLPKVMTSRSPMTQATTVATVTPQCRDFPRYANCRLVSAAGMCRHYSKYCCVTCYKRRRSKDFENLS